jgi:hypothetical protein
MHGTDRISDSMDRFQPQLQLANMTVHTVLHCVLIYQHHRDRHIPIPFSVRVVVTERLVRRLQCACRCNRAVVLAVGKKASVRVSL